MASESLGDVSFLQHLRIWTNFPKGHFVEPPFYPLDFKYKNRVTGLSGELIGAMQERGILM